MVNLVRLIKIYMAVLASFSVHSGVPFHHLHGGGVWAQDYDSFLLMRGWGLGTRLDLTSLFPRLYPRESLATVPECVSKL